MNEQTFSSLQNGRLMQIQPDPKSRFVFRIWFDYTRNLFNDLKEGDLVGVESFESDSTKGSIYSVLKIVQKIPHHYALTQDLSGYPGFVTEAAKSVAESWVSQHDTSDEELTKIVCEAIPTGISLIERSGNKAATISKDRSLPMVGEDARVVSLNTLARVINMDIDKIPGKPTIKIGTHVGHDEVPILLDPIAAMNKHFGIFGFTGAGKSNLLSTFIAYTLFHQQQAHAKFILFDMNDEFTTLLLDVLCNPDADCHIIALEPSVLPPSVLMYYKSKDKEDLEHAIDALLNQLYIPTSLIPHKSHFRAPLAKLLEREVFKLYREEYEGATIRSILERAKQKVPWKGDWWKKVDVGLYRIWENESSPAILRRISELLRGGASTDQGQMSLSECDEKPAESHWDSKDTQSDRRILDQLRTTDLDLGTGVQKKAGEKLAEYIDWILTQGKTQKKKGHISRNEIISSLNRDDSSSLVILIAHRNSTLRVFSHDIGQKLYEHRNNHPRKYPQVSFVFDEADEFVPQLKEKKSDDDSYKFSREIAETISRRGRKYNIGLGISTQRIIYLDTTILSQMQTYFVSKLPRKSDRDRISDAFMLSEAEFDQTHAFEVGEWLLASHHGATGQKNLPMPIKAEDANERVKRFIKGADDSTEQ